MADTSLVDVAYADSDVPEEVAPRRKGQRPRPIALKKQLSNPGSLGQRSNTVGSAGEALDRGNLSDHSDESPREQHASTMSSHRVRGAQTMIQQDQSQTVAALVSPRGGGGGGGGGAGGGAGGGGGASPPGKFVGFVRSKQNAFKQSLANTLQRKPKESTVAPLEEWDGDAAEPEPGLSNASPAVDDAPPIPASITVLPMQPNERIAHAFPELLWAYDVYNPDAMRVGVCFLTNADVGFLPEQSDVEGFRVPLQSVSSVSKVGKKSGKGEFYFLTLSLHDFRSFRLAVPKASDQRGTLYDKLMQAIFVDALPQFFAFARERIPNGNGWNVYHAESELGRQFERLRRQQLPVRWRVCINADYVLCSTYPKLLSVPESVSDELVSKVASFRSRGRFPALSYLHSNGRCITRAAQPMVGIKGNRSGDDEDLVEAIRTSAAPSDSMMIFDARPKVNAVANQAMGKGFESAKLYKQTCIRFFNIANIHVMRDSLHKMTDAIGLSQSVALSSEWVDHVRRILVSAVTIAAAIHIDASPCLVHCLAQDMQVLTSEGFLGLEALVQRWNGQAFVNGLQFATLNSSRRAMEFQPASRLVCNAAPLDGSLIEFDLGSVNVRVTPEHDMYVAPEGGKWQKMTAEEVLWRVARNERFGVWAGAAVLTSGVALREESATVVIGREKVRRVPCDGPSWCVTVPNGLIVVRHRDGGGEAAVVGNCSDGWDRTAQLTSLAMMLLDPFYRTIAGFEILVEKEWLSFGHRFAQRTGHEPKRMAREADQERSPVFLQFCDCVYQLLQLAPCAFEFNELLLEDTMDAIFSCHFGTFLCDSDKERDEAQLRTRTESFWSMVNLRQQSKLYSNIFYDPTADGDVVLPEITAWSTRLWSYYVRFHEKKPKERARPVLAPRTVEEAFALLKEKNELLLASTQPGKT
jgi:hypothetical protein